MPHFKKLGEPKPFYGFVGLSRHLQGHERASVAPKDEIKGSSDFPSVERVDLLLEQLSDVLFDSWLRELKNGSALPVETDNI